MWPLQLPGTYAEQKFSSFYRDPVFGYSKVIKLDVRYPAWSKGGYIIQYSFPNTCHQKPVSHMTFTACHPWAAMPHVPSGGSPPIPYTSFLPTVLTTQYDSGLAESRGEGQTPRMLSWHNKSPINQATRDHCQFINNSKFTLHEMLMWGFSEVGLLNVSFARSPTVTFPQWRALKKHCKKDLPSWFQDALSLGSCNTHSSYNTGLAAPPPHG